MMMKKAQQGFTLIELMIVVAIVGILAALALPAYQDYVVRSKVSEAMARLAEAKTSVAEYYSSNTPAAFPATADSVGVNTAGTHYIRSMNWDATTATEGVAGSAAQITITLANTLATVVGGQMITMAVEDTANGMIVWRCGNSADVTAAGGTAVTTKYLPSSCRG
jgi:type IV pilus assembly protein PilA